MTDALLTSTEPVGAEFELDPAEAKLRALYAHRPSTVRVTMIASADGKGTGADGSSQSLRGAQDARLAVVLRSLADVVVVGGQAARRERYTNIFLPETLAATRRELRHSQPHVAVVTSSGILPPGLSPESTWILTTAGTRAARLDGPWAARVMICGSTEFSPRTAVHELESRGLNRVLCEGGPTVAARFLDRRLVHDYCLTTSPHAGGPSSAPITPVPSLMRLEHRVNGGGFTAERWVATGR